MITCVSDPDSEVVSRRLTDDLVRLYEQSPHRPFFIAVSGGSTPSALYRYWLTCPEVILSRDIHFFWVDERMVPQESSESNYGNAFREFFHPGHVPSSRLHPIPFVPQQDVSAAAKSYTEEVSRHISSEREGLLFDLVILGIGEDGHTSSLFPGQSSDLHTDTYIPSIHPVTQVERVALSYTGIAKCAHTWFHVLGKSKREKLHEVIDQAEQEDLSDDLLLPAARAIRLSRSVRLYTDLSISNAPTQP